MALRRMNLPVELHASTQMCNMTPAQARFLGECGFARVILERALSLGEIRDICAATAARGGMFRPRGDLCWLQRPLFPLAVGVRPQRQPRGVQPAVPPDLRPDRRPGRTYIAGKHLLSVRDLNLSAHIGELLDAASLRSKSKGGSRMSVI